MQKAAREAKTHTSWISPDAEYEARCAASWRRCSAAGSPTCSSTTWRRRCARLAWYGALNSLSATLLKFTRRACPTSTRATRWSDLTLVDPDNRQPVDYAQRAERLAALAALDPADVSALAATPHDGRAKLWITWRLLGLRRERRELFRDGDYLALKTAGAQGDHVVAFARRHAGTTLVAIAGRLWAGLGVEPGRLPLGDAVWGDALRRDRAAFATRRHPARRCADRRAGHCRGPPRADRVQAFARFPGAVLLASG